jgi:hypothetical protein
LDYDVLVRRLQRAEHLQSVVDLSHAVTQGTVDCERDWRHPAIKEPRRSSSDRIRGAPQSGFSREMRRIRSRSSRSMDGWPGFTARDFPLMTVSGWIMASADRQSGQSRESQTQKTRSQSLSLRRVMVCSYGRLLPQCEILSGHDQPR